MNFTSFSFALFFIGIFAAYWAFGKRFAPYVLFLANVFFCLTFKGSILFIAADAVLVWAAALLAQKCKHKKLAYGAGIALLSVTPLAFFKYAEVLEGFFADNFNFGITLVPALEKIAMPVGISYFCFKCISYLADCAKGKLTAQRSFIKIFNSLAFFPEQLSGPITRPALRLSQLSSLPSFSYNLAVMGCGRILYGLLLKQCIAEGLSSASGFLLKPQLALNYSMIIALLAYSVQIFADFAGYSQMAIGLSNLLGFETPENFISPYFSRNIKDFWRKWHISLSSFLKDYIYIPLGGSRCKRARKYFNLLVTFLISGLWHGASFGFAIWGLLHGAYQCISDFSLNLRTKIKAALHINEKTAAYSAFQCLIVFVIVTVLWLPFTVPSWQQLLAVFQKLFEPSPFTLQHIKECFTIIGLKPANLISLAIFTVPAFYIEFKSREKGFGQWFTSRKGCVKTALMYFCLLCVMFFGALDGGNSIYFKF